MSENEDIGLCELKPLAFIKILCHALRFWAPDIPEKRYVYGFLIGKIEGSRRIINDIEPIINKPAPDFDFDEQFFADRDALNNRYIEEESTDRIIGWYKSTDNLEKFKAVDVKNHMRFQSLDPMSVCMFFDPSKFYSEEGYGFAFYALKPDRYGELNIMSDNYRIPWEIPPLKEDKDKTIMFIKDLIDKAVTKENFITEIEEIE